MTVATRSEERVTALPEDLESPRAKLVYLYLAVTDGGTVADVHDALGVPKLTLLSVLDALAERGLVECRDGAYVPAA